MANLTEIAGNEARFDDGTMSFLPDGIRVDSGPDNSYRLMGSLKDRQWGVLVRIGESRNDYQAACVYLRDRAIREEQRLAGVSDGE